MPERNLPRISLSQQATVPGSTNSISSIAMKAPIAGVIQTDEIIGEEAKMPSAVSTGTRMEPEVITV